MQVAVAHNAAVKLRKLTMNRHPFEHHLEDFWKSPDQAPALEDELVIMEL
jgi:hypothetical protein